MVIIDVRTHEELDAGHIKGSNNVEGGIVKWAGNGYPLVNEYLGDIKIVKYSKKMKEDYSFRERH